MDKIHLLVCDGQSQNFNMKDRTVIPMSNHRHGIIVGHNMPHGRSLEEQIAYL